MESSDISTTGIRAPSTAAREWLLQFVLFVVLLCLESAVILARSEEAGRVIKTLWATLLIFLPCVRLFVRPANRIVWLRRTLIPALFAILAGNLAVFGSSFEICRGLFSSHPDFIEVAMESADRTRFDWQMARFVAVAQGDRPIHLSEAGLIDFFMYQVVGVHFLRVDTTYRSVLSRAEADGLKGLMTKTFVLLQGDDWTRVTFNLVQPGPGTREFFVLKDPEGSYWMLPDERMPKGSRAN
jgi:hypothetical protein